jgi:hypothetical protein
LSQFKISLPIKGLRNIIKVPNPELVIDQAKFHFRGNELIGTMTIDSPLEEEAIKQTRYLIEKALAKICFAYNTEASIKKHDYYITDLSKNPNVESIGSGLMLRSSFVGKDPEVILSAVASMIPTKLQPLDLALAYYKLGEYSNPLRIESFFSSMTVIVRILLSKDKVKTEDLKNQIKTILKQNNPIFDEQVFEQDWKNCYANERCSIAHGRGSNLIDPRQSVEYDKLVNTVGYWARELIYYYIDKFQQRTIQAP